MLGSPIPNKGKSLSIRIQFCTWMTRFIVEGLSNVIRIRVPYQLLLTSLLRFSRFFYIKRASKSYNRNARLNTHSTISLPWLVSGWNKWKGHFKRGDHAIKRFDFRERQTSAASYGGSGNENKPRREDGEGWLDEKEKEKTQRENTPSRGICWALLRGLFGSSPVVRGRHRFPSLAHLPFPFSPPSPLPPLSIPLVRKEEGHLSMEVGEGREV